jgi:hypothetical protein
MDNRNEKAVRHHLLTGSVANSWPFLARKKKMGMK